ncbi:hypothetical protein DFH27DRAFT_484174 [Peziza echinospora]|nr:hypothetical protein DFH27DRAFT_484174 [Peziza echinospora]
MYSCVNQPRGCRGRVNSPGGRCDSCRQLNLRKPSVFSSARGFDSRHHATTTDLEMDSSLFSAEEPEAR